MNIRNLAAILALVPFTGANAQSFADYDGDFPEGTKTRYHLMVPMRDGVRLATDIYLPPGDGPFPTLLVRDIYGNGSNATRQRYAKFATSNGYAFVFQSIARTITTRRASGIRTFDEINDGDDTLTWIADQPWSRRQGRHVRHLLPRRRCSGWQQSTAIRPSLRSPPQ